MAKPKRGLVISDLHSGHFLGFMPKRYDFKTEFNKELYKLRGYARRWVYRTAKKYGPYDFMIVNGDCIDGRGEKSGSTELFTTDRLVQCNMAAEAINRFDVPKVYMSYGCLTPGHRILTADLRWVPVESLRAGDKIIGFDEEPAESSKRKFYSTEVLDNKPLMKPVYRLCLSDGTFLTASEEHPFLSSRGHSYYWSTVEDMYKWMYFPDGTRKDRKAIKFPRMIPTWEKADNYASGYLAGFFDGEGSLNQAVKERRTNLPEYVLALHGYQNANRMLVMALSYLDSLGFRYSVNDKKENPSNKTVKITGGRWEILRLLGTIRPMRLLGLFDPDLLGSVRNPHQADITIDAIEYIGEKEVCGLSTASGTYVSEGFLSHNTGYHTGQLQDFEDIIADKVNAEKIGGEDNLDVNGCVINYRHHIGRSSIPHGRHTAIAKERLWNLIWAEREEYPKAQILLRSHVHYHIGDFGPGWLAMITPGLQLYGGKYGSRRVSGDINFGITILDIKSKDDFSWHVPILKMPMQEPVKL